jgi:hypothetical protein
MKKKLYVLGVAALVTAMLALSGVAQSAMWVGAELGGNFPLSGDINADIGPFSRSLSEVTYQPSVIGGATIGYDFVNSGFGAYAWPDWMKYFSFAMDITYNKLNIRGASQDAFVNTVLLGNNIYLKGYEVALTFLFMAHYGLMPDSEVPAGRIHPYIGVGPAILWTGFESPSGNSRADAVNVALVVEPGIRWMCLPNVSVDTAMRYRYAQPSWDVDNATLKAEALHQLSFLVRANYHF